MGIISETPATWLTLFVPPWRSPEVPFHPTYGSTQAVNRDFSMNGWSWLIFHNFLNPIKQATACLSESLAPIPLAKWPQAWLALAAAILESHLGFIWELPTPAQMAAIRLLYRSCRVALGSTQVGADLGLHHLHNPENAHPVDSYRPHQSTTTQPLPS